MEIVAPLVVANSFYSPELTDAARQAAREAVEPVTRSFVAGQTVVTRGQVITAADLEALTVLGLVQPKNSAFNYLGAAALVLLSALFTALYFSRRKPVMISDLRSLILLALLFAIFLVGARVSNPNRTIVPYLFPVPAFALLVSALFGMEHGLVFGLLMSLLAAYGMPDASWPVAVLYVELVCVACWRWDKRRRVGQFLYSAIADCHGRRGNGSSLPPAFYRYGLGWIDHSDRCSGFHRDRLHQHCTCLCSICLPNFWA